VLLGACVVLISYCVIVRTDALGHGHDGFRRAKNAGTAVGLIDGLVYLGTGLQALSLGS